MDRSFSNQDAGNPLLARVHEGMKVYDRKDKEIGTVETVFLGELSSREDRTGTGPATESGGDIGRERDTIVDFALGGFTDTAEGAEETEVLRNRLLREGYVKVDTGLLASDVYVLPDQIDQVSGEKLHLRVEQGELIKS